MSVDRDDEVVAARSPLSPAVVEDRLRTEVVDEPVDLESLVSWATTPGTGAVVTFTGTVRDHSDGLHAVVAIDYEVFERAARSRLWELGSRALGTFDGLGRVALIHRQGSVALGEGSVWVVVSAAHRGDAFEAATYCIDVLKEALPVWKREVTQDGVSHSAPGTPIADLDAAHQQWLLRRGTRTR
jgi:molybdopterin synthase catalytic subunit